jgi:hypothetical protein
MEDTCCITHRFHCSRLLLRLRFCVRVCVIAALLYSASALCRRRKCVSAWRLAGLPHEDRQHAPNASAPSVMP